MTKNNILINRAPILTLWATTVAERLGFDGDEALSLGKAVAGLNAQSKGRRLGIFKPVRQEVKRRAHENEERNSRLRFVVGRYQQSIRRMEFGR